MGFRVNGLLTINDARWLSAAYPGLSERDEVLTTVDGKSVVQ